MISEITSPFKYIIPNIILKTSFLYGEVRHMEKFVMTNKPYTIANFDFTTPMCKQSFCR